MDLQPADRSQRIKTCLSSFERYCSENDRCTSQMSKLKQYYETTITRYKKKANPPIERASNNISTRKLQPSNCMTMNKTKKNMHNLLESCIDPELMGVNKVKLYNHDKYDRIKTQYTVPRKNIKSYLKMKKNIEYKSSNGDLSSKQDTKFNAAKSTANNEKPSLRYRQPTNSTELDDLIVQIKKKSSVIRIDQLSDKKVSNLQNKNVVKKNRVVFSSKGNTGFSRYRFQEIVGRNDCRTSKNREVLLTGWEVKGGDQAEDLGASDTMHLQTVRRHPK